MINKENALNFVLYPKREKIKKKKEREMGYIYSGLPKTPNGAQSSEYIKHPLCLKHESDCKHHISLCLEHEPEFK